MEVGEGPSNLDTVLAMFGQIEKKYLGTNTQTASALPEIDKRIESSKSEKSLEKRITRKSVSPVQSARNQFRLSPEPIRMAAKNNPNTEGAWNNKVQEIFMKYANQKDSKAKVTRGREGIVETSRIQNQKDLKSPFGHASGTKQSNFQKPSRVVSSIGSPQPSILSVKSPGYIMGNFKVASTKESNPSPRLSNKSDPSGLNVPPRRSNQSLAAPQEISTPATISVQSQLVEDFNEEGFAMTTSNSESPQRRPATAKTGSLSGPRLEDALVNQQDQGPQFTSVQEPLPAKRDSNPKYTSKSIVESGIKFIKSFTKGHADINKNSLFGTPLFSKSPGSDKSIHRKNKDNGKTPVLTSQPSEEENSSLKESSVNVPIPPVASRPYLQTNPTDKLISPPKHKPPIKVYFKDQGANKQVQLRKNDMSSNTPKSLMDAIFSKINPRKKSKQNSFDYHSAGISDQKDFLSMQSETKQSLPPNSEKKETESGSLSQAPTTTITNEKLSGVKLFEQHLRNAVAGTNPTVTAGGPPTVQIINSNIYFPVIKGDTADSDKQPQHSIFHAKSASPNKSSTLFRPVNKSQHTAGQPSFSKNKRQVGVNARSYIGISPERGGTLGSRILSKDTESSVNSHSAADRFSKKRKSDQWSDIPPSHVKTDKSHDSVRPGSSRTSADLKLGYSGKKSASNSAHNSMAKLMNRPRFQVGPVSRADQETGGSFSNTILLYKNQNKSYSPSKYSDRRSVHQRERSSVDHSSPKKILAMNSSDSDSMLKTLSPKRGTTHTALKTKQEIKARRSRTSLNSSGTITPLGFDDGTLSEFTMLEELVNRGNDQKPEFESPDNSVMLNSSFVSPILANTTKIYKRDDSPNEKGSKSATQILDVTITKKDLRDFKILDNVKEHDEFRNQPAAVNNSSNAMKKKQLPAQVVMTAPQLELSVSPTNQAKKLFPISGAPSPVHHSKHKYYMEELLAAIKNPNDKQSVPFMNHIKHMAQSLLYIRGAVKPHEDDLLAKSVYLPPPSKRGTLFPSPRRQNGHLRPR